MTKGHFIQGDATRLPFDDGTFDLTFTSPPYLDARTYGIGAQRNCSQWVEWMLEVVRELTRVTKGLVIVNCAGTTRNWRYNPGPEGLLWKWWEQGGECWRPAIWHRVGIPGSGGKQWLRADTEYLLAFKRNPGPIPWADNLACGHPPKWAPGGAMSHRLSNGDRRNQWGRHANCRNSSRKADGTWQTAYRPSHVVVGHPFGNPASTSGRRANGDRKPVYMNGNQATGGYDAPVKANPGNVLKVLVGGGVMGHPLAHENEAPFPEALAEFFIKSFCPPGGTVLDPFSGSGTTVCTAVRLGRHGVGVDLRMSQVELGRRRLASPMAKKKKKRKPVPEVKPEQSLFALAPAAKGEL